MTSTLTLPRLDSEARSGMRSRAMPTRGDADSDGTLVLRARSGDQTAAQALFLRHGAAVANLALRLLRHRADAEEATQDAFVLALDRLGQLRAPEDFGRWIRSITVNACRQQRRAAWWRRVGARLGIGARPEAPLSLDALAAPSCSPEARETLGAIDRALQAVPQSHRDAWTLHVIEGWTLPDTAAACGCSLATVKRWIAGAEAATATVAKLYGAGR